MRRLRRAGPERLSDRGAASILLLAVGLFFVGAGLAGAEVEAARNGRHQAQTAADLGALAGAAEAIYGERTACARAGLFVVRNGGVLEFCELDGLDLMVRARVHVKVMAGLAGETWATARAGPLSAPAG